MAVESFGLQVRKQHVQGGKIWRYASQFALFSEWGDLIKGEELMSGT